MITNNTNYSNPISPYASEISMWSGAQPNDILMLSQRLIDEISQPTPNVQSILNDLQEVQKDVPNIDDKKTLDQLLGKIEAFDNVRAQKSQHTAYWRRIENFVMGIKINIINQLSILPDADMKDLLEKVVGLVKDILTKIDQSQISMDEITYINTTIEQIQKQIDSLSSEINNHFNDEINNISNEISNANDMIDKLAGDLQKHIIEMFSGNFRDFIEAPFEEYQNFYSMVATQDGINWGDKADQRIINIVQAYISENNLPKLIKFVEAIKTGFTEVQPNPTRANKILSEIKKIYPLAETLAEAIAALILMAQKGWVYDSVKIKEYFGLNASNPPPPQGLTREILNSPCPFEPNKKIIETHYLMAMPEKIDNHNLSWEHFTDKCRKDKKSFEANLKNGFTISGETFLFEIYYPGLMNYNAAKWLLFWPGLINLTVAKNIENEYDFATIQEFSLIYCFFASLNEKRFHYNEALPHTFLSPCLDSWGVTITSDTQVTYGQDIKFLANTLLVRKL